MDSNQPVPRSELAARAEQVMIAMRDGVHLATDIYLPLGPPVPWPVVLVRTPYDKGSAFTFLPRLADVFNDRGYAFVAQDVRGRGRSGGERRPLEFEVADGYDTLDWIAQQPWSDGTAGMFGDSYLGFTSLAAAVSGHPSLKAIVPRMIGTDRAVDHDGVYSMELVEWAANYQMDDRNYARQVDWSVIPLSDVIERSTGQACPPYERLRTLTVSGPQEANQAFFGTADPQGAISVPTLHWTGYWDLRCESCIADYTGMRRRPKIGDRQYLILDAIDHEFYPLGYDGPAAGLGQAPSQEAIEELIPAYTDAVVEFFDRHVRDATSIDPPRVRWNLAHVGWQTADDWPPPSAETRHVPLLPDDEADSWLHDPANPVPDLPANPWSILSNQPDEQAVESRADVLTFTSSKITTAIDLAGPAFARLSIRADAPSMHAVVKLVDVWPDGVARRLLLGARLVPAADYGSEIEIRLGNIGYRIQPGHRIRIELASSCYPFYEIHPATADDPWTATERRAAVVRLLNRQIQLAVTTLRE
jgi:uncharacterized protein